MDNYAFKAATALDILCTIPDEVNVSILMLQSRLKNVFCEIPFRLVAYKNNHKTVLLLGDVPVNTNDYDYIINGNSEIVEFMGTEDGGCINDPCSSAALDEIYAEIEPVLKFINCDFENSTMVFCSTTGNGEWDLEVKKWNQSELIEDVANYIT